MQILQYSSSVICESVILSASDKTFVCEIRDGKTKSYEIDPADFGFEKCLKEDLVGGNPEENAQITLDILKGQKGPKRNAVVSLSLNCKIDQQLNQASVLLKIPFDILETGTASYYFLAFANGITQPITLYTNKNANEKVTEIKNYDAIPANTAIRAFVTIVEEKFY